ncbi:hypothetical protein D3C75_1097530 [compost metagenome]
MRTCNVRPFQLCALISRLLVLVWNVLLPLTPVLLRLLNVAVLFSTLMRLVSLLKLTKTKCWLVKLVSTSTT